MPRRSFPLLLALAVSAAGGLRADEDRQGQDRLDALAAAGERIFFDTTLSNPAGQGCVSCHLPEAAFADPRPVSPGAAPGRQGTRNAPGLMYAALIPNFSQEDLLEDDGRQLWVWQGGLFQDGSARSLDEQVRRPFFEHAEMNLGGTGELSEKLRDAPYSDGFRAIVGEAVWGDDTRVAEAAYRALVEFLKTPAFRPFDARIDDYLEGDEDALDEAEKRGLELFRGKAKCADCHFLHAAAWPRPLLSDYGFDNLGVPSRGAPDPGLGGHTGVAAELGQFRAPTLRNVALTAPYFHNGSVATLREVVEFYNRRDLEPERWGPTDYPSTVNHEDLGDLGLGEGEVDDLVALMDAFTDRSLLRPGASGSRVPPAPAGTPGSWRMRAFFPDWIREVREVAPHPTSVAE